MITLEQSSDKTDSISLSKNSKGYTWDIKIYNDDLWKNHLVIVQRLKDIDTQMNSTFNGVPIVKVDKE